MFKKSAMGLCLAVLGASSHAVVAVGAEVHFSPSFQSVLVGQVFDLVLQGAGFDVAPDGATINNISGGQRFNFSYSAANLEVVQVTIDPRWTFGSSGGTIDQALGTVTGIRFGTFPATLDDTFNIATVKLRALASGEGTLTITSGDLSGRVDNVAGKTIVPQFHSAVVAVVPEPSQWALLLLGLGIIGTGLRRR